MHQGAGLDHAVMNELARLQIPVLARHDDLEVTDGNIERLDTPLGPRSLPASFSELMYGFDWSTTELNGTVGHHDVWMCEIGTTGQLYQAGLSRAYGQIGSYDGGNYMILVDFDDPRPMNPMIYVVDHDTADEEGDPTYAYGSLSEFLAGMTAIQRTVRQSTLRLAATLRSSFALTHSTEASDEEAIHATAVGEVCDLFREIRNALESSTDTKANEWLVNEVDSMCTTHILRAVELNEDIRRAHNQFRRTKYSPDETNRDGRLSLPLTLQEIVARELQELQVTVQKATFSELCDCQALIEVGLWRQPKSPDLTLQGPYTDGHYIGDSHQCGCCGTMWFQGARDDDTGGYFWEVI